MLILGQQPGECDLARRQRAHAGKSYELVDLAQIGGIVGGDEARIAAAEIVVAEDRRFRQRAGQNRAAERGERDQRRAGLFACAHEPQFGPPGPQRILALHRVDGPNGRGATQRRGRDLGEADGADLACLLQSEQGLHYLLDRPGRLPAVHVVEVDVVEAEALQRGVEGHGEMLAAVVEAAFAGRWVAVDAALGGQVNALAGAWVGTQKAPNHPL
jgi:hypothetical protein